MALKAIDTRYAGHLFRSRLEARWAVVLDHLQIRWQYEAEGYEFSGGTRLDGICYLPDFWLPDLNTFLEIKGTTPTSLEHSKLHQLGREKNAFTAFGLDLNAPNPLLHYRASDYDSAWPKTLPRPAGFDVGSLQSVPENEHDELCCPVCRDSIGYAHTGAMTTWPDGIPDCFARGPVYTIPVWHEQCGHNWDIVLAFHKGNTSLLRRWAHDGNRTPLDWACRGSALSAAIRAGRSARFEHGANGGTN